MNSNDKRSSQRVSLDALMQEIGYACTSTPKCLLAAMEYSGITSGNASQMLSEAVVSRILVVMCRTLTGLETNAFSDVGMAVFKGIDPAEIKTLQSWDIEVFMATVYDVNPQLDWFEVIHHLDQKDFLIFDSHGVFLISAASKIALHDLFNFPINAFFGRWLENPQGQFSFLKNAIQALPDLFSVSAAARRVIPTNSNPALLKGLPPVLLNQPWNSLDLIETLLLLEAVPDITEDVRTLLELATQQFPELMVLGLAQLTIPWTSLHKELASNLVILFLVGHPSSSFVLPLLWQISQQLCLAGLVHLYSKDPSSLSRILDVAQEMKALSQILETKAYPFSIDLAALASRRDFLNLEKWLQDRIRQDGSVFVKATLELLRDKVASQLLRPVAGSTPSIVPLSVQVVGIFLRILQANPLSRENTDYLKELIPACFRAYPRLSNILSDVEDEATSILHKCYAGEVSVPQVVELLKRYRDSINQREQDVFSVFTVVLFEEYQFFPNYPDDFLGKASVLFGSLILSVYTRQENVAQALRIILESLRQPVSSKYFKFGSIALLQFQSKLPEWPNFCSLILQIPHMHQAYPEITSMIKNLVPGEDSAAKGDTMEGPSGEETITASKPPVFAAVKLDTLLDATEKDSFEVPAEGVQDRILFIINNLTLDNIDSKVSDMKERLKESHIRWLSHYIVVNRASIEPNNHSLYIKFLDNMNFGALERSVLHETYANIRILLNSDKTVASSSERQLLNNLGIWLGSITLARNKPIKHKNLSFKDLLLEGFECDRLIVVIPFVCKVLEQCQDSRVFKPPNPWLMAIMKLLLELYHFAELKMNLQLPIIVLCKNLNLVLEDSLYPISVYITLNPKLPIFNAQPSMRRIVHIAIDRAVREIIQPVVERSVTIAGIATREMILKDFALEPNEDRMRKAAHLMVQNLSGNLAAVSSREPLRISMMSQLRNLLLQNGFTESEEAVYIIVADNLDLACSVMEKAAAEKAISEIDEALLAAFISRRKHREQRAGQPFCDISIYASSRYPSSLPDILRLKPGGLTPSQLRVYEEFIRGSRGDSAQRRADTSVYEELVPISQAQLLEKFMYLLTPHSPMLPPTHDIRNTLQQILTFVQTSREDFQLPIIQKFVQQLFKAEVVLARECYVVLLEKCGERANGKKALKEFYNWLHFSEDKRKLNLPVIHLLIRAHMINVVEFDLQLARQISTGNQVAGEFAVVLIQAVLAEEPPIVSQDAFFNCSDALVKLSEEGNASQRVEDFISKFGRRFLVLSPSEAAIKDAEASGLRDKIGILFSEWVKLFNHSSTNQRMQWQFISQLHQQGILQGEDAASLFFRICTELSVETYIKAKANPGAPPESCFQAVDAFARLIVLLVHYYVEQPIAMHLTTKILSIVVLVLVHSHEQKRDQFNQRPFFRLFSSLLNDLNVREESLQPLYFQILSAIRFFMPKLLLAEGQKGWPFFQRLLVDLFKFLNPYLTQSDMADTTRLLYKATLRILLVLLHDFPEFLCDYHFSFVDVIPHSAFPRNMRLPDPLTPNLKVDLLPETNQPPHVLSDYTSSLIPNGFKADIDAYLKTRSPVTFLFDLRSRLLLPGASTSTDVATSAGGSLSKSKYNINAINALVLYVGVQAITQTQSKHLQQQGGAAPIAHSAPMDIFQQLVVDLDTEGRYLFLSAIANQLRYPNSHTHYFSCVLLYLFAEASQEIIQEQITRVLIERLIVNRPHPYGLLITFIELIRNPRYNFWEHTSFIRLNGSFLGGYPTADQIVQLLKDAALKYPELVRYRAIGTSSKGREIPAVVVTRNSQPNGKDEVVAVDRRHSVIFTGMTQPREGLSMMQVLYILDYLVTSGSDDAQVRSIVGNTRTILVPMINPDGYGLLTESLGAGGYDTYIKSTVSTCPSGNATANGVNLGHNYGFMWEYPATAGNFSDPCDGAYRGVEPFSEPETRAIRDLFLQESPKASIFFHSRSKSHKSRILVPYVYHKSFLSTHREDKKNKLMNQKDLDQYDILTMHMQSAKSRSSSASDTSDYEIGTAWEAMQKTISGSELDWAFDQAGSFALIVQVGTAESTYWPPVAAVPGLLDKHLYPALEVLERAGGLTPKVTAKGPASAIARGLQTAPLVLGVLLAFFLMVGFAVARFLGYDDIFGRFKANVKRAHQAVLARFRDGGYVGVPNSDGLTGRRGGGGGGVFKRWWERLGGGGRGQGQSSASGGAFGANAADGEIGFEDVLELDAPDNEEDGGVGYSYRQ
ncbi:CCR4-Not complex component, Not1-domain-containing protein [Zopfochytrium polystomum]|nr:CCR4-Not complex component, Not1-domain-containing protein [Zopfochytrium polystomum]